MVLKLFFNGEEYDHQIHLSGLSSTMVSSKELQHLATPDSSGRILPQTAKEGSAIIASAEGEEQNLDVVLSIGTFNVKTATCGTTCPTCLGIVAYWVYVSPFGLFPGINYQIDAWTQNESGGIGTNTIQSTWTTSNSSIGAIAGAGLYAGLNFGDFGGIAKNFRLLSTDHFDCIRGRPCPTWQGTISRYWLGLGALILHETQQHETISSGCTLSHSPLEFAKKAMAYLRLPR